MLGSPTCSTHPQLSEEAQYEEIPTCHESEGYENFQNFLLDEKSINSDDTRGDKQMYFEMSQCPAYGEQSKTDIQGGKKNLTFFDMSQCPAYGEKLK